MNNHLNKKLSVIIIFIVILIGMIGLHDFRYNLSMPVNNIFSEIYEEQKGGINPKLSTNDYNIHVNSERDTDGYTHTYSYNQLDSAISVTKVTITKKGNMLSEPHNPSVYILIGMPLENGLLYAKYDYDPESQTLTRILDYDDNNLESEITTSDVLKRSGKSVNYYTKIASKVLKDKVLKDWCSVYDSDYTPNDWGDIQVKKWQIE